MTDSFLLGYIIGLTLFCAYLFVRLIRLERFHQKEGYYPKGNKKLDKAIKEGIEV